MSDFRSREAARAALTAALAQLNQVEAECRARAAGNILSEQQVWDVVGMWAAVPPRANADLQRIATGLGAIVHLLVRSSDIEGTVDAAGREHQGLDATTIGGLLDAAHLLTLRLQSIAEDTQVAQE